MVKNDEQVAYIEKSLLTARILAETKAVNLTTKEPKPERFIFSRLKQHADSFLAGQNLDQRWVGLPGLRGTGKSTLLAQLYLYLVRDRGISATDVLYISMDNAVDHLNMSMRDVIDAYESVTGEPLTTVVRPRFLLLDEVHFDAKWAQAVKDLYERAPNVFIVVTGSSALALQANSFLGVDILRRMQIERVEPLRFIEYMMLKGGLEPPGLSDRIFSALFASASAGDVERLLKEMRPDAMGYAAEAEPGDLENFLVYGSLPISINLPREEVLERTVRVIKETLRRDIRTFEGVRFRLETIGKFPQLVTLLASWEDVSVKKLSDALELNHLTVIDMLDTLKKSGLLSAVPTYGGTKTRTTRPPRYAFRATSAKAAFLWSVGQLAAGPERYGPLFEDMFVHYFSQPAARRMFDIFRIEKESEADFVLKLHDGSLIACEVSYGSKGPEQVRRTMARLNCKYGLVISKNQLARKGDIVFVPREFLFAY